LIGVHVHVLAVQERFPAAELAHARGGAYSYWSATVATSGSVVARLLWARAPDGAKGIGRRTAGSGVTGYLVGGTSVRIATADRSVVVSMDKPYQVVNAIQRRREVAGKRPAG
jgi:hypothetical protein